MNSEIDVELNKYSEGVKKIYKAIVDPKIKVISFDVFDTLLLRPVSTPADTFRLLENHLNIPNFHNMRFVAEQQARKRNADKRQDITIDDIYKTYSDMFCISSEEADYIKETEKDLEYQILYSRKTAHFQYDAACETGKTIILISDMYLSAEFINRCLNKNGYDKHAKLYVSSDVGLAKSTGDLYKYVIDELKAESVNADQILHIGDNKRVDYDNAREIGMRASLLPKTVDVRNKCKNLKGLYSYILSDVMNSNNAMLYGYLANCYFDDPFIHYENASFYNGDPLYMGYWFGPLMLGFTKWLLEIIIKNNIEQMVFVLRDGYLPLQLFDEIKQYWNNDWEKLDIKTMYMGRTLRMPYLSKVKAGLFTSFYDYPLDERKSVDYFIKNRLLCEDEYQKEQILKIFKKYGYSNELVPIGKVEQYGGFVDELTPFFLDNSKSKIERSSQYINSVLDKNKKIGIFDRSPRGKGGRFLKDNFGLDVVCISTEIYDVPKAMLQDIGCKTEFYLQYGNYYVNKMGRIWAMLFERIISDIEPGYRDVVINQDGEIKVLLDEKNDSPEQLAADKIVKDIQKGIFDYVSGFAEILGSFLPSLVVDKNGVFDYCIEAISKPERIDAELIKKINPDLSVLAPINETTFTDWYNKKFPNVNRIISETQDEECEADTWWVSLRKRLYFWSERKGIRIPLQTLYHGIINKPFPKEYRVEKIREDIDAAIEVIKNSKICDIDTVVVGSISVEVAKFINALSEARNKKFIFLSMGYIKSPDYFSFQTIDGPSSFGFWGSDWQDEKVRVEKDIVKEVNSSWYMIRNVKRRMLSGYSKSLSIILAYEEKRYVDYVLENIKPSNVLIWNGFGKNGELFAELAREKGINVILAERGFEEGTIMLSHNGYGNDDINTDPVGFMKNDVSDHEIQHAEKIINYQRETKLNRYVQPSNKDLDKVKGMIDRRNPIITFIGAFDIENPGYPLDEHTKGIYNACFETSDEAAFHLSKLAQKNKWNIIYKRHPLMEKINRQIEKKSLPSNIFHVREADVNDLIDMSDVVVTMISGLGNVSLVRGKPLVELAYTPLRDKGCCYQCDVVADVEKKIIEALEHKVSPEQMQNFVKYIALSNKYYYFDDLNVRDIRYGRNVNEALPMFVGE